MRLGQLARKLTLRQIEIVDFLASQNIQIEDGSNTRLEDQHADLVIAHFAPHMVGIVGSDSSEEKKNEDNLLSAAEERITPQDDIVSEVLADQTPSAVTETEKETNLLPESIE